MCEKCGSCGKELDKSMIYVATENGNIFVCNLQCGLDLEETIETETSIEETKEFEKSVEYGKTIHHLLFGEPKSVVCPIDHIKTIHHTTTEDAQKIIEEKKFKEKAKILVDEWFDNNPRNEKIIDVIKKASPESVDLSI